MRTERCRRTRRIAGLLALLLLCLLCTGGASAQARAARTLRVAFPELDGVSELDEYGNHRGLLVDYLNEIAKYTDWEYIYVPVDAMELVDRFMAGEFDLMGGTFYSPGFEEYFGYPDYGAGRSTAILMCLQEDDSLKSYDLTTLNGKTIGVYENATEKIRHLQDFLSSYDLTCHLRYYGFEDLSPEGDLYERLRSGEVDMLMGNETELGSEFRTVASFQAQPYYIVTQPGDTALLDGLNTALAYIMESTPTFADEVYEANFPDIQMTDIQLNEEELAYVTQKGTVTVAVPHIWHPIYCVENGQDHHGGMLPELLEEIAAFSGLEFEYVCADTYDQCIQMVLAGEADLLGGFVGEAEDAFSQGLALSCSYASISGLVLKYKSVQYPGEELVCGIMRGRYLPAQFMAAEIREYDSAADMLAAVNRHEVDYIYGASAMLEREMQSRRYINVSPVSQTGDSVDVSFALARPLDPQLLTVLNKAVSNIPSSERAAMLNRNLISVGYSSLTIMDLIYDDPVIYTFVFFGILVLLVWTALRIQRNRMNRALMEGRLKDAEAKSSAKSEFLSRMSHEIRTPMNAIVGLADLACMEEGLPHAVEDKLEKIRGSSRYLLALINDILDMSRIENGKTELDRADFSLSAMVGDLDKMLRSQAEQNGLHFQVNCRGEHDWVVGDPVRLRQVLTNLLSNAIKFTPTGGTVSLTVVELAQGDDETATYHFSVADTGIGIAEEDMERIFLSFEQIRPSVSRSVGTGLGLPISRSMVQLMGGDLLVESTPGQGSNFYMTLAFPLGTAKAPAAAETGPGKSLEGVRVLLAEDNDLNAEIAMELLAAHGIKAERAVNGQEAVTRFVASPIGAYRLILMDIRMPIKDGYDATRAIRSCGRADANVPIVAMTANSFREDEEAAKAAGMNGFVPKPVDVAHLLTVMRELL